FAITPAPRDGTIIGVFLRRVFNIERLRPWANVSDRHFGLHSEYTTIIRELSALIARHCEQNHRGGSKEPKGRAGGNEGTSASSRPLRQRFQVGSEHMVTDYSGDIGNWPEGPAGRNNRAMRSSA